MERSYLSLGRNISITFDIFRSINVSLLIFECLIIIYDMLKNNRN